MSGRARLLCFIAERHRADQDRAERVGAVSVLVRTAGLAFELVPALGRLDATEDGLLVDERPVALRTNQRGSWRFGVRHYDSLSSPHHHSLDGEVRHRLSRFDI